MTPVPLPLRCDVHPLEAARHLLGCDLVHVRDGRRVAAVIVEVEAYGGEGEDPASHAYRRRTARNAVMFGAPGRLYVYFTYGMHHCVNVTAHRTGEAGAVLVRAAVPTDGLALMRRRRRTADDRLLCSGPARLAEAFGFTVRDDGRRLDAGRLHLQRVRHVPDAEITWSGRVGLSGADDGRRWRCCDVTAARWLSRPP